MYSLNLYMFTNIYISLNLYIYMYLIYVYIIYMYMFIFKFPPYLLAELMCKEETLYLTLWLTPYITKSPGPLDGESGEQTFVTMDLTPSWRKDPKGIKTQNISLGT